MPARSPIRDADADLVIAAADPGELGAVELRRLLPQQRVEAGAAADDAEHRAVLGGDAVEPVGEPQAAGALHVLDDDGRVAGNVPADVPREHPGIEIIAAADAVADVEIDVLALVEIGRALGVGERGQGCRPARHRGSRHAGKHAIRHLGSPPGRRSRGGICGRLAHFHSRLNGCERVCRAPRQLDARPQAEEYAQSRRVDDSLHRGALERGLCKGALRPGQAVMLAQRLALHRRCGTARAAAAAGSPPR